MPGGPRLMFADLRPWLEYAPALSSLLSSTERNRSERFRFDEDRRRSVLRRALLRILLAAEVKAHPQDVRLESRTLLALASDVRLPAFFHCWTRQEAYLKAVGVGLTVPLSCFSVSVTPGDAMLTSVDGDRSAPERWRLMDVAILSGYVAAAAMSRCDDEATVHDVGGALEPWLR